MGFCYRGIYLFISKKSTNDTWQCDEIDDSVKQVKLKIQYLTFTKLF